MAILDYEKSSPKIRDSKTFTPSFQMRRQLANPWSVCIEMYGKKLHS